MKLEDFRKLVEGGAAEVEEGQARYTIVVGMGTCGIAAGAREVLTAIMDELERRGINDVIVTQCGCRGRCELEPMVAVQAAGQPEVLYVQMTGDKARQVIARHVEAGEVVRAYVGPAP